METHEIVFKAQRVKELEVRTDVLKKAIGDYRFGLGISMMLTEDEITQINTKLREIEDEIQKIYYEAQDRMNKLMRENIQ